MFPNMAIYADAFSAVATRTKLGGASSQQPILWADFVSEDSQLKANVLGVIPKGSDTSTWNVDFRRAHLLVFENVIGSFEEADDVIWIEGLTHEQALNIMQQTTRKYAEWEYDLRDALFKDAAPSGVLRAALPIFKANLFLHDKNMRLIAYEAHEPVSSGMFAGIVRGEMVNHQVLDAFLQTVGDNIGNDDPFASKRPQFWKSATGNQTLGKNIYYHNAFVARLVLTAEKKEDEPTAKDLAAFNILSAYVRQAIITTIDITNAGNGSAFSSLIMDLIEQRHVERTKLLEECGARNWNPQSDSFVWTCADVVSEDVKQQTEFPFLALYHKVNELFPQSHRVTINGRAFVLVNLTACGVKRIDILEQLRNLACSNNYIIAVSREFERLARIASAHKEVEAIIDAKLALGDYGAFAFEDVVLQLIVSRTAQDLSPLLLCPVELIELIHHDNKHGTKFYETVKTFVECNCNASRCAEQLFIRRNTLYYRLDKIDDILHADWNDPETQLRYRIAFLTISSLPDQVTATL